MTLEHSHGTRKVQDFVDLYARKRLNLSPAFQRQSVWSTSDRRLLVNSVFDGIPMPSVYLYERIGRGGQPVYDVIDGKQRIETLLLFIEKGPLARTEDTLWVKRSFDDEPLDWWDWSYLSSERRHAFLSTEIPTIEVRGDLGEIIELFVRINSTGRRLTPQERRNAHYFKSPVLKAGKKLADALGPQLVRDGVVSRSQAQRMKHVELLTELMLAVNAGMPLNKKSKIDEVIKGDVLSAKELAEASANLKRAIKVVDVMLPNIKSTRLHQTVDYYSLVLLMHRLKTEGYTVNAHRSAKMKLAQQLLTDFALGVDQVNDKLNRAQSLSPADDQFRDYLMTIKADTDSRQQRDRRERILRQVLDGVFTSVDPARSFNTTQRRIIWNSSKSKTCSICGGRVKSWGDMSADHVVAFSKGGATRLSNAALAHKKCNSGKGAR